jgi:hypothetical protein
MFINDVLRFFEINQEEVNSLDSIDAKVEYIFNIYKNKTFFDTTKNFINKKLFYEPQEAFNVLNQGYGLNCQEQIFLLKEILGFFDIKGRITHGDVYDFDTGIKKDMFISILIIDRGSYFIHIDSIHKLMLKVNKKKVTHHEGFDKIEIHDFFSDFYLVKKFENGINYYIEKVYKNAEETFRVKRLKDTYGDLTVTPFGIIPPFYWGANPEKKVFYNILQDKIRIVIGRKTYDFDLLQWDMTEESNWLSVKQKEIINKCVSEIIYNIDDYMVIAKNAAPKIDSKIREEHILSLTR